MPGRTKINPINWKYFVLPLLDDCEAWTFSSYNSIHTFTDHPFQERLSYWLNDDCRIRLLELLAEVRHQY